MREMIYTIKGKEGLVNGFYEVIEWKLRVGIFGM